MTGLKQVVLLWLAVTAASDGGRPEIVDFKVSFGSEQIAVNLELRNGLDEALLERLESGLPTDLTYRFSLYRDRKRWFDGELVKSTYQVIAMYNAVSREYLVNFKHDGNLTETRVVRDLAELERAMTVLENVPIFNLADMRPKVQRSVQRSTILVRGRAELGPGSWLWIFPQRATTDWVRSRKFSAAEGG